LSHKYKSNNACTITKVVSDKGIVVDQQDISNVFNEHFCSVGDKLSNLIPFVNNSYTDFLDPPVANTIFIEEIYCTKLYNLIRDLKVGKAAGDDLIIAQLIKKNAACIIEPLLFIFNLSLSSGVVPDKLKVAKVILLNKKGDHSLPSNYRPISLLSVFNKLLEKVVYKRLYNFFTEHDVLYKYQFGFRNNYSTNLALIETVDMCYNSLDKNNYVLGLFIDFQKSFDTVNHSILLNKLYKIMVFMALCTTGFQTIYIIVSSIQLSVI